MKLHNVEIVNFRSIKNLQLTFDPPCRVLVGINESGKSNILKALATLGPFVPVPADVREPAREEEPVSVSEVTYEFRLEEADYEDVLSASISKVLALDPAGSPMMELAGATISLDGFVRSLRGAYYETNNITGKKHAGYYALSGDYSAVFENWKKPRAGALPEYNTSKGLLSQFELVNTHDFPLIPPELLETLTPEDINDFIGPLVGPRLLTQLPSTVLWQYKEENLLPSSIAIATFSSNPDSCLPLKNMFLLAGITDIAGSILRTGTLSKNSIANFYASIADKATAHFRTVWPDHDMRFELRPEGDNLVPGIRESNVYDLTSRSDGFKRFVAFLLLVSALAKSGSLSNTLLLIDEPEISLHPSGTRHLRDELLRISETNYVIFSTHSIFMIDRENIGRHLIIKKEAEQTRATIANDSNIVAEEVIYNALGFSVFETLQASNIIFEGWRDKHLFQLAIKKMPSGYSEVSKALNTVGLCHANGVKHIKSLTPIIELARRRCLIVSDGDKPAREKQKEYVSDQGFGIWKRYDELITHPNTVVTGEDFIKVVALQRAASTAAKSNSALKISDIDFTNPKGRLAAIDTWLGTVVRDKEERQRELNQIKGIVFDGLKPSDIEDYYFEFLRELASYL